MRASYVLALLDGHAGDAANRLHAELLQSLADLLLAAVVLATTAHVVVVIVVMIMIVVMVVLVVVLVLLSGHLLNV